MRETMSLVLCYKGLDELLHKWCNTIQLNGYKKYNCAMQRSNNDVMYVIVVASYKT